MIKGKALRRALETKDAARVLENIPLLTDTTEFMTPEKAHELLKKNRYNRPTNWKRVEEYSDLMSRGEWKLTPQGIILDSEGNLLNGQNRLWAIVYSGVGVHLRISRGSSADIAPVIDRGASQTARDLATRKTGKKHSPTESSIARGALAAGGKLRPSTDEIAATIQVKSEVVATLLAACTGTKKTKAVLMILAAIAFLAPEKNAAVRNLESLASDLEADLKPLHADQCWNKGAVFLLAMGKSVEIVKRS